jgi:hypothetical protein
MSRRQRSCLDKGGFQMTAGIVLLIIICYAFIPILIVLAIWGICCLLKKIFSNKRS